MRPRDFPWQNLLAGFLARYQGLRYSDYARLQTFVVLLVLLGLVALILIPIVGLSQLLTGVFLALWSGFCAFILLLIRTGGRAWAEGLSALGFTGLLLGLIFFDGTLQGNQLGDTLLLVYAILNLVLVTLITANAWWVVATAVPYLAAELVFRYEVQEKLALAFPFRFVIIEATVCTLLVTVQRIIRKANTLAEEAQAQLTEANQVLRLTVDQQALELQKALDGVRSVQASLSVSDKLSTVGRFVAGIAHEINTPLAAIESSASQLKEKIRSLGTLLFSGRSPWTQADFTLILEILDEADLSGLKTSSRERREFRKRLPADLPPEVADGLAYWGVLKTDPRWVNYLTSSKGPAAFELLAGVVELYRSAAITSEASAKAAVYVRELKSFMAKDNTKTTSQLVSITDSLDSFLFLYQHQLRGRIEVVKSYEAEPLQVLGNPSQILQIWSNLITNAIGAMGEGGRLELTVRKADRAVEVLVADNGTGIPEGIQSRIFEPFFSTKASGEGLGLGLEIVKNIVDAYQGTIGFESRPGRTQFQVRLPLFTAPVVTT